MYEVILIHSLRLTSHYVKGSGVGLCAYHDLGKGWGSLPACRDNATFLALNQRSASACADGLALGLEWPSAQSGRGIGPPMDPPHMSYEHGPSTKSAWVPPKERESIWVDRPHALAGVTAALFMVGNNRENNPLIRVFSCSQ